MATKTLGTIIVIILCILLFPVGIGIVAGVFGIVIGAIGGVFGAIFGMIGGLLGAIFGGIGWFFENLFDWDFHDGFGLFDVNIFTIAALVILVALLSKNKRTR
jgi:hypothetical protein